MKQTKVFIKLTNLLCFSTHQRCLCVNNSFVINNPLCSPFLCVTFLQNSNLKRYHSKLQKTQKNNKQIIACYYFSGYVILYHVDIKKKDIDSHYWINKMLEQKTFMILKEAEALDYIPLKVTSSMGLRNTPVYSIFHFLKE